MRRMITAFLLIILLAGCAGNPRAAEVSTTDQLIEGLQTAGATVEKGEAVYEVFFSAPGQELVVNGQKIYAYEYADEAARQKESSTISADGFGVGTSLVDWVDIPHFWAKGRLIVLYVGQDQPTIDLLSKLLGSPVNQPPA